MGNVRLGEARAKVVLHHAVKLANGRGGIVLEQRHQTLGTRRVEPVRSLFDVIAFELLHLFQLATFLTNEVAVTVPKFIIRLTIQSYLIDGKRRSNSIHLPKDGLSLPHCGHDAGHVVLRVSRRREAEKGGHFHLEDGQHHLPKEIGINVRHFIHKDGIGAHATGGLGKKKNKLALHHKIPQSQFEFGIFIIDIGIENGDTRFSVLGVKVVGQNASQDRVLGLGITNLILGCGFLVLCAFLRRSLGLLFPKTIEFFHC